MAFNPGACGHCISKVSTRIRGYDPREMARRCATECLSKGKGPKAFRRCLAKRLRDACDDAAHADRVASEIWGQLKRKCSG